MNSVLRVGKPPAKPLLIFDGDCAFCRCWIARWQQSTGDRVEYLPLQSNDVVAQFPELSRDQLETAIHLVEPTGRVSLGAEAVFRSQAGQHPLGLWLYENVPGVRFLSEFLYQIVAHHRAVFSRITRLLWGERVEVPTYFLARRLFLSLLGLVYLVAFLSFQSQWRGLIGSHGIVPAAAVMKAVGENLGPSWSVRLHQFPTLCWWRSDDAFLSILCLTGVALAVLVTANIAPAPCLFLLWLIYLSLAGVSTVFLGYQWDYLLLEAGLVAVFLAPSRLWPGAHRQPPPSSLALWLGRFLLFRLIFSSAVVKWLSGDPTWHNLTALTFHYETQPLPTSLAWFVHQWPPVIHRVSCGLMFLLEGLIPFSIFLPRRPRLVAFWGITGLMTVIALTGNYTFFNLLTIALAVLLLDDRALARLAPRKWTERVAAGLRPAWIRPLPQSIRWLQQASLVMFAVVCLASTSVILLATLGWQPRRSNPLVAVHDFVAPLRSFNGYGLFAVMTTNRFEIEVEGSDDGSHWSTYEFRYKPGDLQRRPPFVAPHQPRLDWQMWFAALGEVRDNPWFIQFCRRLQLGEPEVIGLLARNPFPQHPPNYIRASLYEYHFTTAAERATNGAWWRREYRGVYCPALSLERRDPTAPTQQ